MRYIFLFIVFVPILCAQDGAAIYKERCTTCHDATEGRAPPLSAIKKMSGQAIYIALTSGPMKDQAQGLTTPQIFSLIGFIGPTEGAQPEAPVLTRTCAGPTSSFELSPDTPQWNGWSSSASNSRFQSTASAGIAASDVPTLKLKWAFNLGAVTMARSQPSVAGGRVFFGTLTGAVYSLDAGTGCTQWGIRVAAPVRSGVTIGEASGTSAVFFADASSAIYALKAATGEMIWKSRPVDQFAALITAAPQVYKGVLYQAFSSFEEGLGPDPSFQCCTFRGSVVALDASTGKTIWQTFTIPEAAKPTRKTAVGTQQFGPSGAGVWSTPTIDEERGVLYVATGDNYSDPPTETSDAVLAMDLKTGELLWSQQLTKNDAFNVGCSIPAKTNCPEATGPDFDFGQPPILVRLAAGKRALVIAQKSGMVHALDPDQKGKVLWQTRAGKGSPLGGSQWGSTSDGDNVYVAISDIGISNVADPSAPQGFRNVLDPNVGGGLHALNLTTGKIVLEYTPEAVRRGPDRLFPRTIGGRHDDSGCRLFGFGGWTSARLFD